MKERHSTPVDKKSLTNYQDKNDGNSFCYAKRERNKTCVYFDSRNIFKCEKL